MSWLFSGSSQKLTGSYPGGQKMFRCNISMDEIEMGLPENKWQTSGDYSWAMEVSKIENESDSKKMELKVCVKCRLEEQMKSQAEEKWQIDADHLIRLVNHTDSGKSICTSGSTIFGQNKEESATGSIHISILTDEFLQNDELTFEVEIGVKSAEGLLKTADFSVKTPNSNTILIVGKEKFFVNDEILSKKSKVFKTMFSKKGEGKANNEYPIDDVDSTVFHSFIKFVSDIPVQFTLDHIEELFKMSENFGVQAEFKAKCNDFLMNSVVDDAVALKLADKFGMQDVIVEKLKPLKTIPELKKAFKYYRRYSDESMRLLLKKLIQVA